MEDAKRTQIVVLGGGYAGVTAALRVSRETRGESVVVTLVSGSDHFVERIRLHQLAANETLKHYSYAELLAGSDVRFVQGWVTVLSPSKQVVHVHRPTRHLQLRYDYLVYALGSTIDMDAVPGAAEFAASFSTEDTARSLQEQLAALARRSGRLVVCGGGLTGIEAASELAEAYPNLKVTLVTRGRLGDQLSRRGGKYLRRVFARMGIRVCDRRSVEQIQTSSVELEDGSTIAFDICLWAGSFTVSSLAQHYGLPVNEKGQIVVDEQLRVKSWPNIYAVGDAATLEKALKVPIRMACATAVPMARYVGTHLAATVEGTERQKPYAFRYFIRCISLGRKDGLIQFVNGADVPKEQVLTGRLAAVVKEFVCRSTVWNMKLERLRAALGLARKGTPWWFPDLVRDRLI